MGRYLGMFFGTLLWDVFWDVTSLSRNVIPRELGFVWDVTLRCLETLSSENFHRACYVIPENFHRACCIIEFIELLVECTHRSVTIVFYTIGYYSILHYSKFKYLSLQLNINCMF